MQVFRIAKTEHIRDLSGIGARLSGGRWNRKGTSVIYTAENRSLATVEFLVHVPFSLFPDRLSIAVLEIPDDIVPRQISISDLPPNWRDFPPPPQLAEIGSKWVLAKESLLIRVPSAVVENEFNLLINPAHPAIKRIILSTVERYAYDKWLLRTYHKKVHLTAEG